MWSDHIMHMHTKWYMEGPFVLGWILRVCLGAWFVFSSLEVDGGSSFFIVIVILYK